MSETKASPWVNVGSIVKNVDKDGNEYQQFILNKEFIANAKELLAHAYTDKKGNKRFSMFKPREGAPDYVLWNVLVKKQA